jgi:peptidoglycan/LPS O-acetylase OafA/YrhL
VIDVLRKLSVFYVGLDLNGVPLFVLTTLVTWLVASFTYNLIEYPFKKKQTYLGQPA